MTINSYQSYKSMKNTFNQQPELPHSKLKMKRHISLKVSLEDEDDSPPKDLKKLTEYISHNIKSERQNIISLYSTSIQFMKDSEEKSPSPKKRIRNEFREQHSVLLSPTKDGNAKSMLNDIDLVVSSHFPSKTIATTRKIPLFERRWQPLSPTPKKPQIPKPFCAPSPSSIRSIAKSQAVGIQGNSVVGVPERKCELRKKVKKARMEKVRDDSACQLNPWEYLTIQDQPVFNESQYIFE